MCIHLWRRSLRAGLKHRRCRCDTCRVGHTEEQADRRRHPSRKRASASLGRSTRSSSAIDSCSARAARRPVPQVGRGRGPQAGPPRPGCSWFAQHNGFKCFGGEQTPWLAAGAFLLPWMSVAQPPVTDGRKRADSVLLAAHCGSSTSIGSIGLERGPRRKPDNSRTFAYASKFFMFLVMFCAPRKTSPRTTKKVPRCRRHIHKEANVLNRTLQRAQTWASQDSRMVSER